MVATYEQLLNEAYLNDISVYEMVMQPRIKGLFADSVIWINKELPSSIEKRCVLGEELGHYHTSSGDILDQSTVINRKQELKARRWAYDALVPLDRIIYAHKANINSRYELADFLNVTEDFLKEAIKWYISKYGHSVTVEGYTICFEPLGILEMYESIEKAI